jgi:hypothetical protein
MPRPDWRRGALLSLALCAGPSAAADDAALLKDLTTAIRVLGLPCGEVLSARRQAESDHIASCANGDRYRVFVTPQGRLTARKQ